MSLHCTYQLMSLHCTYQLISLHCTYQVMSLHCTYKIMSLHCTYQLLSLHCTYHLMSLHCTYQLMSLHCTYQLVSLHGPPTCELLPVWTMSVRTIFTMGMCGSFMINCSRLHTQGCTECMHDLRHAYVWLLHDQLP